MRDEMVDFPKFGHIYVTCIMASVQDLGKCAFAGTFLTLYFAWFATQNVGTCCIVIQHHNRTPNSLFNIIDNYGVLR